MNINKRFKRIDLEKCAICLGLSDSKKFKNKQLLFDEIVKFTDNKPPSTRCENKTDPYTQESIDDIDPMYRFEWIQNDRRWCADARNIKEMFKTNSILPWAIDYSSGLDKTKDAIAYNKRFDMKLVDNLLKRLDDLNLKDLPETSVEPEMSLKSWLNYKIDSLVDSDVYVNIDIILALEPIALHRKMSTIFNNINTQLYVLIECNESELIYEYFSTHVILHYGIFSSYTFETIKNLVYLVKLLTEFKIIFEEHSHSIIKYVFIELVN